MCSTQDIFSFLEGICILGEITSILYSCTLKSLLFLASPLIALRVASLLPSPFPFCKHSTTLFQRTPPGVGGVRGNLGLGVRTRDTFGLPGEPPEDTAPQLSYFLGRLLQPPRCPHRAINSTRGTRSQLLLQILSPQMRLVVLLPEGPPSSHVASCPSLSLGSSLYPPCPPKAALALVLQV